MPGRTTSSGSYRYGFNGKEADPEVKGTGAQQDYGFRIYDPRIGKFLSVDPLTAKYPELTPYQFGSNRPIDGIDEDGLEWAPTKDKEGKTNGYSWVGYNGDGTAKANSDAGGVVSNGEQTSIYSSDAKSRTGNIHIIGNFTSTGRGWWQDHSTNYVIDINIGTRTGSETYVNTQAWTVGHSIQSQYVGTYTTGKGLPDHWLFHLSKSKLGLQAPSTSIDSDGLGPVDFLLGAGEFKLARASSKIIGFAQKTGTKGHAFTSNLIAWRYAFDPRVERVTLDLGYKRLLGGGAFKWGPRPDVGVLFKNGTVKTFEIMSKTDVEIRLFNRNFFFMQRNRIQGSTNVVKPFSLQSLYK